MRIPKRVKCSNSACDYVFKVIDNQMIVNDPGYVIKKCVNCGHLTKIPVHNVDLFENCADTIKVYEPGDFDDFFNCVPLGEELIDPDILDKGVFWEPAESSTIWSDGIDNHYESCNQIIQKAKKGIEEQLALAKNAYLAGQWYIMSPKWMFVKVEEDKNGKRFGLYAKKLENEYDFNPNGLKLLYHNRIVLSNTIDGLLTRDDALRVLNTCLNRWNVIARLVIVAVPFIGLQYKGKKNEEQVVRFWQWLGNELDMSKTVFITRRSSFTLRTRASKEGGPDFCFLKKWGKLDELSKAVEKAAKKNSKRENKNNNKITVSVYPHVIFYQKFHAKFYAGIVGETVEVLFGSYNIHEGPYIENLSFRTYSLNNFKEKFMSRLCPDIAFEIPEMKDSQSLDIVVNSEGKVASHCNVSKADCF